jgi:two-component system KDP operon response regulator KdpE
MAEPLPIAILIEDEPQIRRFVRTALEAEGWSVHEAETMRQGQSDARARRPDLIILDLGLPDGDGVEFLHDLRGWSKVPVIVLSARVSERDKVAALDAGADDYLTKPFGVAELLARVRATSRRHLEAGADASAVFTFGDVKIDLSLRTAHKANIAIHLTPIEYRLLSLLIANAGKVLTHRQILREVWGPTHSEDGHYVRVYMGHLRQKLEDDPAQPKHILTETAVGYRLVQSARS